MIVAYEISDQDNITLSDSTGLEDEGLAGCLNVLLEQRDGLIDRVCWNLDETVAPLIRMMGPEKGRELWETSRCQLPLDDGGATTMYEVFYSPSRVFSVSRKRRIRTGAGTTWEKGASLYGLDQYFPDEVTPHGLTETMVYGQILRQTLKRMGLESKKLTSPIAIFEETQMRHMDIPNHEGIPRGALEYAYQCAGRLWVEAHQIGCFDKVFDYDLKSAFPNAMRYLQDTRECDWYESNQYQPDATFGVCKGIVTIRPKVTIHPIMLSREEEVDISPTGTWETFLMKPEIDLIRRYKLGTFEIQHGFWGKAKRMKVPMGRVIEKLLNWRGTGDPVIETFVKRLATGLYGKTLEEWSDKFGPYWNPVWGSEISAQVRCKVAKFIYSHKIKPHELIQIGVDGVMVTREIERSDAELREWKLAYEDDALVVSSGLVFIKGKKPHGLTLEKLLRMMKENPDSHYYGEQQKHRVTLGQAIQTGRWLDLGKMIEMSAAIDLSGSHDRVFDPCPRTGGELLAQHYQSRPYKVENDMVTV